MCFWNSSLALEESIQDLVEPLVMHAHVGHPADVLQRRTALTVLGHAQLARWLAQSGDDENAGGQVPGDLFAAQREMLLTEFSRPSVCHSNQACQTSPQQGLRSTRTSPSRTDATGGLRSSLNSNGRCAWWPRKCRAGFDALRFAGTSSRPR